jgi:sugar phosphate isomerase/epimerase
MPKVSLCQLSLPQTSFDEDIAIARSVHATGLGVDETKLAPGGEAGGEASRLVEAGLSATICAPAVLTILPRPTRDAGPADPASRVSVMLDGIQRLAPFSPEIVFCSTGPQGDLESSEARQIVVESLRRLSDAAEGIGARLGLEPMRKSFTETWTIVTDLGGALTLLDEVGRDSMGLVFDMWHMWDSNSLHEMLPAAAKRIIGVQVADYRSPTRAVRDRVAAGEGIANISSLLAQLRACGYDGWYDMEVFSDTDLEGSLWRLPPAEFAAREVNGFLRCWEEAQKTPPALHEAP